VTKKIDYTRYVITLMVLSALFRGILASVIELGNDEVYYRLYALYPDWSHFDHPLMVGWVMQLFSFNLLFYSELFLRMSSIVFGTINLWLMFQIGKTLRDERTGFFAALLYTSSLYGFVITGIFILPDTPQGLFWLWAILIMLKTLPGCPRLYKNKKNMIKLGIILGLGIISKYTTVFLWGGMGVYILFFNRRWLKSKYLYMAVIATIILSLPILIWNLQNDFISFTFHGDRVSMAGRSIRFDYFLTEIIGEIAYNNPINFVLIILALAAAFRQKISIEKNGIRLLLIMGLPLIITFLIFSLTRSTLPHWTAPGYTTLIPLAAAWLAQNSIKTIVPRVIKAALGLLAFVLIVGLIQIKTGWIPIDQTIVFEEIGEDDPSLDMFGYTQTGKAFVEIVQRDQDHHTMNPDVFLVGDNWFPLANYDYYAATPAGLKSYGIGTLDKIHKYAWINNLEGGFVLGSDAYYLTDSRDFKAPDSTLSSYFESVTLSDTIEIPRGGKIAKRVFVYRMNNMVKLPTDILK
jgi:hypothetical protein